MDKPFPIKAVLFDLVGTLIYVKGSVGEVYSSIASGYGLLVEPRTLEDSFHKAIHKFPLPKKSNDQEEKGWWKKVVYETFKLSGIDEDIDIGGMELVSRKKSSSLFENLFESIYEEFKEGRVWGICPDVIPVFERLKREKIKIGLISNFDNRLEIILKELDLYKYFDCLSYSGKTGFSKPSPKIFQYALDKLKIIPEEAMYIGDSLEDDYYPALSLSINAVLINRNQNNLLQDIKSISNLNQIFEFLN